MPNRDVIETRYWLDLARETIRGLALDDSIVWAKLPHKTLMFKYGERVSTMSHQEMARTFPKMIVHMGTVHDNDPLKFNWERLAMAVDTVHGVYGFKSVLNTP